MSKEEIKKRTFLVSFYITATGDLPTAQKKVETLLKSVGLDKNNVQISPVKEVRTSQQNRALHLFFTQLADALNEKGFFIGRVVRFDAQVYWTPLLVKEVLWKPLQSALFGTKSTTQLLKTGEIDKIYDILNKAITERTGGEVSLPPFPSIEELSVQEMMKNYSINKSG